MKLNMNPDNYVYQIDYEDLAVSIFSKIDAVPEKEEFELSAHEDTYNRIKEFMKTSVKMDGGCWNEDYKVWETLIFWDDKGESTTVPICGAKLGAYKSLSHDELKEVLELLEFLEKEDEECRDKPTEPVKVNFIDSNGISRQGVIVSPYPPTPTKNGRIYTRDTIDAALKEYEARNGSAVKMDASQAQVLQNAVPPSLEVNFTNIIGDMTHPTENALYGTNNADLLRAMVDTFGTFGTKGMK